MGRGRVQRPAPHPPVFPFQAGGSLSWSRSGTYSLSSIPATSCPEPVWPWKAPRRLPCKVLFIQEISLSLRWSGRDESLQMRLYCSPPSPAAGQPETRSLRVIGARPLIRTDAAFPSGNRAQFAHCQRCGYSIDFHRAFTSQSRRQVVLGYSAWLPYGNFCCLAATARLVTVVEEAVVWNAITTS